MERLDCQTTQLKWKKKKGRAVNKMGLESVDWIYLAQDTGQWLVLLYTVVNVFRVS
jgi:hypothetical protein